MNAVRYLAVGECAISVEFGDTVDLATNGRVLALDRALAAAAIPGVIEAVPTYRALMIHFDPLEIAPEALRDAVEGLVEGDSGVAAGRVGGRSWRIPVCYGGAFGIDLADLAARHGLSEAGVVGLHSSASYRVYMIGFSPGFAYLGGLPEQLHTPRRNEPRLLTPAGSVSIGGAQAAVASVAAPSGWHLIGRTPLTTFDPAGDPVFLFDPGDRICFEAIAEDDWHALAGRVLRGEYRPLPEGEAA